ncbi:hypothetical protein F-M6_0262 [Faustovirus]|nr:hypothetical protein F-M6_0262 [Faustovirus]
MEKIRSIPYGSVKSYHVNSDTLTKLYIKYFGDYDFIHDIVNKHHMGTQSQVLPPHTYTDGRLKIAIHESGNVNGYYGSYQKTRPQKLIIIVGLRENVYFPIFDQSGKPVYYVDVDGEAPMIMEIREIIKIIANSTNQSLRTYMTYKILSMVTVEDLYELINPTSGYILVSNDNYTSLYDPDNKLPEPCRADFALECTDGVNVMIHKVLLARRSPVIEVFVREYGESAKSFPNFPFPSELVKRFVFCFYRQKVSAANEHDTVVVFDYLQILSSTVILDRYARALGYETPKAPTTATTPGCGKTITSHAIAASTLAVAPAPTVTSITSGFDI